MKVDFRFPKEERLRSKKLIDSLFKKAERSFQHPLIAVWKLTELPDPVPVQVGFSAPKKHFKKAVTRNLVKRRLRECYRLNKHLLQPTLVKGNKQVAILFVMLRSDNISYEELSAKMMLLLRNIAAKIERVE